MVLKMVQEDPVGSEEGDSVSEDQTSGNRGSGIKSCFSWGFESGSVWDPGLVVQ